MTSTHNPRSDDSSPVRSRTLRPRTRMALPETDYTQLLSHLTACEQNRGPGWTLLAYVLHNKIVNTEPVSAAHLPNVATGSSFVTYTVHDGPEQTGLLIHRARSDARTGVIPVCSLLGATLIGMQIGQRSPLLCDDGTILSLNVTDVTAPN